MSDCTILDNDNIGLKLEGIRHCKVTGCLIRDDRDGAKSLAVKLSGEGNLFSNNLLGRPLEVQPGSAVVQGNAGAGE